VSILSELEDSKQLPFISVIIATRNEEKYIGKLLDSISKQTFPKENFEVLIVDGLSTDSTLKVVNDYSDCLNIRVLANPKIRAPSAFNIGISQANSGYFIIIGAHSYLKEDFLEKSVETFLEYKMKETMLVGVGGICINEYDNNIGKLVGLLYGSFFSGARSCRYKKTGHFSDSVIFGLFEKKFVVENGCFDEDFLAAGDDDELTIRLHNRGFKFFTNPSIVSHYFTRNSLSKFIKQTYNYGVAKGLMVRKGLKRLEFSNSASLWFIPASLLIYEVLILAMFVLFGLSWVVGVVLIPFFIYFGVSVLLTIALFKETKSKLCLFLPFTYFLFHNILGLSSILGLLLKKRAFI
jgi:dolichyl N-acetyl-alpha-D-glucosaminyl phosphate 3-beta-D-2,3-diacetamido-2,3-dideoxy-beta-D-glucuronosyltransferase